MLNQSGEVTRLAVKDAIGFPALTLLASMTGFGSLVHESGLPFTVALAATAGIWGLPGQLTLVELHAAGASAFFVILAVALANARFLPMVVSFVPLIRTSATRPGRMFVLVQMLSINSWAAGLRRFPIISPELRQRYYIVFASICMVSGLLGTAIGFLGVGLLPRPIALGLIFLNPLFFAILLAGAQGWSASTALLIGAPLGVIFHLIAPDLDLLITGVVGGTLAFFVGQKRHGREKNHD